MARDTPQGDEGSRESSTHADDVERELVGHRGAEAALAPLRACADSERRARVEARVRLDKLLVRGLKRDVARPPAQVPPIPCGGVEHADVALAAAHIGAARVHAP